MRNAYASLHRQLWKSLLQQFSRRHFSDTFSKISSSCCLIPAEAHFIFFAEVWRLPIPVCVLYSSFCRFIVSAGLFVATIFIVILSTHTSGKSFSIFQCGPLLCGIVCAASFFSHSSPHRYITGAILCTNGVGNFVASWKCAPRPFFFSPGVLCLDYLICCRYGVTDQNSNTRYSAVPTVCALMLIIFRAAYAISGRQTGGDRQQHGYLDFPDFDATAAMWRLCQRTCC